jgi:hypothetical protein
MSRTTLALALALAAVSSIAGCYKAVATTGPQHVEHVKAQNVQGPYVPAGTNLTVRMNTTLDTLQSPAGGAFTATVETPLRSPSGEVVVPAGALLQGTLASAGTMNGPRLRLTLNSIQTASGPASVFAAVRHAQRNEYPGPTTWSAADGYVYPYDAWGWWGPYGGGPYYAPYTPTEIRIPEGASMQLTLTRPIIPPGTRVMP